jgi:ParB-like chromosome segregation protein Spo0J
MGKKKYKLGWVDVEVKDLVKAEWNYKEEDKKQTEKLIANFKKNGQVENIQIRELGDKYEVVNGNHRLDVMKEIGMDKAHAYNYGEMTKAAAQIVAIETNETRFRSNAFKLAETFEELKDTYSVEEMTKTMPFDEKEIFNMIEVLNFDWEGLNEEDESLDLEKKDVFNNLISLKVSSDTFERWLELKTKMKQITGYDNDSKVFEFAIIEALNIPIESLQ